MKQRSRFAECRVEIPALNALAPITESIRYAHWNIETGLECAKSADTAQKFCRRKILF
ncbi:hypothetical protein MKLM6_3022 [Methylomonas koyamae]|uniref:hypothetical protein n=1 Tax=Methylomonas koyamae TaxID=702114 RepID=UPI000A6A845C|nr:hypothetical protein [Methylomonas koyamae]ATG91222.1 hypothetical protein MKLM6_3022 [Methylomonas koyamae]